MFFHYLILLMFHGILHWLADLFEPATFDYKLHSVCYLFTVPILYVNTKR